MSHYSQSDFDQNPNKYKLFKTARMAVNVDNLTIGQDVSIRYLDARIDRSQPRDPLTPIFEVVGLKHYVFARALADFCL
jgi:hypothetical protein